MHVPIFCNLTDLWLHQLVKCKLSDGCEQRRREESTLKFIRERISDRVVQLTHTCSMILLPRCQLVSASLSAAFKLSCHWEVDKPQCVIWKQVLSYMSLKTEKPEPL
jgi:hypothetical protein